MPVNDTTLSGPAADELTPLEISRAVLEAEENPNELRAITPLERAASGETNEEPRRSRIGRFLLNPAVLGGAAVAGVGLIIALAYGKKPRRPQWRTLRSFRT
ncbi:hypothetical protein M2282_000150 [Variovorax boronicumulans]|uniref:hypothetical protein n=1 Tax=Variovorax boronicumulans TaxID=436515 RepID=UPI002476881D|nr:hypothetical protein [Variovorax boronicumulans]MDH6165022.1 hypothetical protein [Variovorax boronicumulans]